jgi:hypothetical protein
VGWLFPAAQDVPVMPYALQDFLQPTAQQFPGSFQDDTPTIHDKPPLVSEEDTGSLLAKGEEKRDRESARRGQARRWKGES